MEWTGFNLVARSAVHGRWVHWLVCMTTRRLLSCNQLSNKFLISESLLFSGDAKTDLYTSSSHNMISKPIKLTSFRLKLAVESIGNPPFMSRPRKIENFQHKTYFNLSANQQLQPFSGWKHLNDIKKKNLSYKFVLMTDILQSNTLYLATSLYFVSFLQQRQFYTLLLLPWRKSLFSPDFRGSSDQPQPGFFLEARERTLGTGNEVDLSILSYLTELNNVSVCAETGEVWGLK